MKESVPVDVALHCPAGNVLGEGPLWDPDGDALVWVDIPRGRVMRLAESVREPETVQLPEPAGCVARLAGGDYLVAAGRSLYRVSFGGRGHEKVLAVGLMDPSTIANDGAADPGGRFVFGSKHTEHTEPKAAAFSVGGGAGLRVLHAPVTIFNGPAFGRGGDRIYFADTLEGLIFRAPYDPATGRMGDPEVFVRVPAADGLPGRHGGGLGGLPLERALGRVAPHPLWARRQRRAGGRAAGPPSDRALLRGRRSQDGVRDERGSGRGCARARGRRDLRWRCRAIPRRRARGGGAGRPSSRGRMRNSLPPTLRYTARRTRRMCGEGPVVCLRRRERLVIFARAGQAPGQHAKSGDGALRVEGVDPRGVEAEAGQDLPRMLAEAGGVPRDPGR